MGNGRKIQIVAFKFGRIKVIMAGQVLNSVAGSKATCYYFFEKCTYIKILKKLTSIKKPFGNIFPYENDINILNRHKNENISF